MKELQEYISINIRLTKQEYNEKIRPLHEGLGTNNATITKRTYRDMLIAGALYFYNLPNEAEVSALTKGNIKANEKPNHQIQ